MYCLFLDTSFDEGAIALFKDGKTIAQQNFVSRDCITPHLILEDLLKGNKLSLKDMNCLAVGIGPGSYTGLRNAVSVIKTIAYVFRPIMVVPVPSLIAFLPTYDTLQQILKDFSKPFRLEIVEDAKVGGIYIQKYTVDSSFLNKIILPLEESRVVSMVDLEETLHDVEFLCLRRNFSWLQKKIEKNYIDRFLSHHCITEHAQFEMIGQYIHESYVQKRTVVWNEIEIAYLRKTQAEIEKQALST